LPVSPGAGCRVTDAGEQRGSYNTGIETSLRTQLPSYAKCQQVIWTPLYSQWYQLPNTINTLAISSNILANSIQTTLINSFVHMYIEVQKSCTLGRSK